MHAYYPPIKPYKNQKLKVDDTHELYIEEAGDPDGLPVLVLHGGPGLGSDATMRRFFDPSHYRIILFDQRGSGRSTPHAELNGNTTQNLVNDIEKIREHLNINKLFLFGGSWGATLALVYAQTHPDRIAGMILRGVFLGRVKDIEWFYQDGANKIFPDYWKEFVDPIKPYSNNVIKAYYDRLTGPNELARMAAAKAWSTWEARCATLHPHTSILNSFTDPTRAISLARIECHYFMNHCFLEDNQILENIRQIQHIPCTMVHGRYDLICPIQSAWDLHHAWPNSELYIVRDAGHAASEPGTIDALIHATQKMSKQFSRHA